MFLNYQDKKKQSATASHCFAVLRHGYTSETERHPEQEDFSIIIVASGTVCMVSRLVTRTQPLLRRRLSAVVHTVRAPLAFAPQGCLCSDNLSSVASGCSSPLPLLPLYASLKQKQSTHAVAQRITDVKVRYAFHLDICSGCARLSVARPNINLHSLGFNEGSTPDCASKDGGRQRASPTPDGVPPSSEARGSASLF